MKKRMLMLQEVFEPHGGANAVAAWILQALRDEFDITLLTLCPVDLDAIDSFYGTDLASGGVRIARPWRSARALHTLLPDGHFIQVVSGLLRQAKRMAPAYDVALCAGSLSADFGVRGIQYAHDDWIADRYEEGYNPPRDPSLRAWLPALLRGEARPWMALSHYSFDRMRENLTIVNSEWTAERWRRRLGVDPIVVHPPVPGRFDPVPWERREDAVVCMGRIAPSKRIDWIVRLVDELRERGRDLRLVVIGSPGGSREERAVRRDLLASLASRREWMTVHEQLPRPEMARILSRVRYGVHAQVGEPFGIAPAEMVRAGCLTFVHRSGGQVEVVDGEPRLVFDSFEDATAKVEGILDDPAGAMRVRDRLIAHAERFDPDRFVRQIRDAVERFERSSGQRLGR